MKADDAKRLKELEKENVQLKRPVADKELEILAHKEISKGRMKVKSLGPGPLPAQRYRGFGRPAAGSPLRPPAPAPDLLHVAARG